MPRLHNPRHGSMQFWPRKRAKHSLARVRSWPQNASAKPLAFVGYKAGMTHIIATDNRPKALTKNQDISLPVTIVDCPPLIVCGVSFYKNSKKIFQLLAPKPDKDLGRRIPLPKKEKTLEFPPDFDDLRLLVQTQPKLAPLGTKKPHLHEIALGGSKEEKVNYAQQKLGQEIKIGEVFEAGNSLDAHGITKGKGFQGTVKRFGVPIRQHKSEKTKRGIGTLGSWTPKRVQFTVPQAGKMGYHLRTDYNKQILKISDRPGDINPSSGLPHYGLVKNPFLLLRGSLPGPKKKALLLIHSIRLGKGKKIFKEAPEIKYIAK